MKKHLVNLHKACGLAITLVAANAIVLLIPPINSGYSESNALLSNNSIFHMVAKADEPDDVTESQETTEIILEPADFMLSADGKIVKGLSASGVKKVIDAMKDFDVISLTFSDELQATEIGKSAFYINDAQHNAYGYFTNLKRQVAPDKEISLKIKFSNSITKISENAFSKNSCITRVDFGNRLDIIDGAAFQGCRISGKLNIPESVTVIGDGAFNNNENITEVKIPDNIITLGTAAFNNNSIRSVDFGAYDKVQAKAFINHPKYGEIPKNRFVEGKVIPTALFADNLLTEIKLPNNIVAIGQNAFRINDDYKSEHSDAFTEKIQNISIPETVKAIGEEAFKGVSAKTVTFSGNNLEVILRCAFCKCDIEGGITLPDSIEYIGEQAFASNKLRSIFSGKSATKLFSDDAKNPFADNTGWHNDNKKVALYRANIKNEFVTDNMLNDSKYYAYNPIALDFNLKDKEGTNHFSSLKPQYIKVERANVAVPDIADIQPTDYDTYKLGDKLTFKLGAKLPENYKLATAVLNSDDTTVLSETILEPDADGQYEVTLDPLNNNIVQNISYGNNYEAGYKKTTFTLKYIGGNSGGDPIIPPSIPSTPEQPATPSVDVDNQDTPRGNADTDTTDITDDTNPRGDANTDTTDISDDTSPRGEAKSGKKVVADKNTDVNVDDTKVPLGTLPKTGGSNENIFVLLGGVLLGLGFVIRRKIR